MEMTKTEIIREYKMANSKTKQIGILAELNLCTKKEIREILREGGLDVPEPGRKKKTVFGKVVDINQDAPAETEPVVSLAEEPDLEEIDAGEEEAEENNGTVYTPLTKEDIEVMRGNVPEEKSTIVNEDAAAATAPERIPVPRSVMEFVENRYAALSEQICFLQQQIKDLDEERTQLAMWAQQVTA